jgi:hypothetical protein
MSHLTKSEIIHLFYGDSEHSIEPNDEWKLQAELLGLNPDDYIVDLQSGDVVNIYELYNALMLSENDELKVSLDFHKEKIYGNLELSPFMIAPKHYEFYGNPQNRTVEFYAKKFAKTKWSSKHFLHYARQFSQGDTIQPLNTEEMIHQYSQTNPVTIDEETLSKITEADLTIHEWERTMILKELISLQSELNENVPNHNLVYVTDKMPKKFMYGQCKIYNSNTKKFLSNNKWIAISK